MNLKLKLKTGIFACLLLVSSAVMAQKTAVTGTVKDYSGEVLPGVSIRIIGATQGTVTGADGEYSINVPDEKTVLEFSYIGYVAQQITVDGRTVIDVILQEDVANLDEVVVVGYGSVKKSNLTGAVASVKMSDIPVVTTTSVSDLLTGRIPGLSIMQTSADPTGDYDVLIRGATSTNASNSPLYVVDGFPGADISIISPNDIESVEVMKDASATAIYGARAANGVILINTKKGKSGSFNVNVQLSTSLQTIANPYDVVSAKDLMTLTNEFFYEKWLYDNRISPYGTTDPLSLSAENAQPKVVYSDQQIASAYDATDWFDAISRTGVIDNENISISGGNERATYTFSLGHIKNKGVIINSGYDKYMIRLSADFNLSKWLTTGVTLSGIQQDADKLQTPADNGYNGPDGVIRQAIVYPKYLSVKDEDGNYVINPNHNVIPNPVSYQEVTNTARDNKYLITNFWNAQIIKDLNFRISWGVNQEFYRNNQYYPKSTLLGRDRNSYAYIYESSENDYLLDATLTYNKQLFGNHNLKAMAGYAYQTFIGDVLWGSNSDFVTDIYNAYNLGGGGDLTKSVGSSKSITKYLSYFGRLNYDIADKYLFTFTLRADGSDRFGKDNRYGYFPSGAVAWRISEEDFLKGRTVLSNLKLRLSLGQTGNSEIGGNAYGYYVSGANYVVGGNLITGVSENQLASSKLKWETTTEFNAGLDFGFFGGKLSGSFDYFYKTVSDLLDWRNVGSYYPVSSVADNLGTTLGRGWEFRISNVNIRNRDFEWTTDINLAHFYDQWKERNPFTILSVYNTTTDPLHVTWGYQSDGLIQVGDDYSHMSGADIGSIKLKDLNGWLKDSNGNYILDKDGRQQLSGQPDGAIDDADKVIIVKSQPDLTFGLYNTLRYKNFDLNFFFYGEIGRQKYNNNILVDADKFTLGDNVTTHAFQTWRHDRQDGIYPSGLNTKYAGSNDFWVENADFIRLKTLSLGYTLPQGVFGKLFQNARLYVDFQNLFVLTNYSGTDPETDSLAAYPNQRTYSLGINLNF
jgi:TonB-linked SusC/RagA family outer membrane protein